MCQSQLNFCSKQKSCLGRPFIEMSSFCWQKNHPWSSRVANLSHTVLEIHTKTSDSDRVKLFGKLPLCRSATFLAARTLQQKVYSFKSVYSTRAATGSTSQCVHTLILLWSKIPCSGCGGIKYLLLSRSNRVKETAVNLMLKSIVTWVLQGNILFPRSKYRGIFEGKWQTKSLKLTQI